MSRVSIPFKRESTAKVGIKFPIGKWTHIGFNSLQTGKHSESFLLTVKSSTMRFPIVSIPFKRESTAKGEYRSELSRHNPQEFQFPSNGKAQRKASGCARPGCMAKSVSIPFKRESTAKEMVQPSNPTDYRVFQFPSNGKAQRKLKSAKPCTASTALFQFPSNGKAQRKFTTVSIATAL